MRYLIIDTEPVHLAPEDGSGVEQDGAYLGRLLPECERNHLLKRVFENGYVANSPLDFDEYMKLL